MASSLSLICSKSAATKALPIYSRKRDDGNRTTFLLDIICLAWSKLQSHSLYYLAMKIQKLRLWSCKCSSYVTKSLIQTVDAFNAKEIINIFLLGGPLFFPLVLSSRQCFASKMIMKLIILHTDCFPRIISAIINVLKRNFLILC